MLKKLIIASFALSLLLFTFYMATGNETVLAPILISLLVCFSSAMTYLSKR